MKQDQVGTIVGSSVHLTGAIKDSSDITIFGSVEGEVTSDARIIIEESAYVKGPVSGTEVILSGFVNGTVTASERLELNATGTIKGNIDTKELLIHSGATFIGKCTMPDKSESREETQEFQAEIEENKENKDSKRDGERQEQEEE